MENTHGVFFMLLVLGSLHSLTATGSNDYGGDDGIIVQQRGDIYDESPSQAVGATGLGFSGILQRHDGYVKGETPTIPKTSFACSAQPFNPGLYADMETQCQVYHVCFGDRQESFLCGPGTNFNQKILACDFWYNFNCQESPSFYDANADIGKIPDPYRPTGQHSTDRTKTAHPDYPREQRPISIDDRYDRPGPPPRVSVPPPPPRIPSPQPPRIQPQPPRVTFPPPPPRVPEPPRIHEPAPLPPVRVQPPPPKIRPPPAIQQQVHTEYDFEGDTRPPSRPVLPSSPPSRPYLPPPPPPARETPRPVFPPVVSPPRIARPPLTPPVISPPSDRYRPRVPTPQFPTVSDHPDAGLKGSTGYRPQERPRVPQPSGPIHVGYPSFPPPRPPTTRPVYRPPPPVHQERVEVDYVPLPPKLPSSPPPQRPIQQEVINFDRVPPPPRRPPTTIHTEYIPPPPPPPPRQPPIVQKEVYVPPPPPRQPPIVQKEVYVPPPPPRQPPPIVQKEVYVPPPPPPPPRQPPIVQKEVYVPPPPPPPTRKPPVIVQQKEVYVPPPPPPVITQREEYVPPPPPQRPRPPTDGYRPQSPSSPVITEAKRPSGPPPRPSVVITSRPQQPQRPRPVFPPASDHPNANIKGGPGYQQPPPQPPRFEPTRIGTIPATVPRQPPTDSTRIQTTGVKTPSQSVSVGIKQPDRGYEPPKLPSVSVPLPPPRPPTISFPPSRPSTIDHPSANIKGGSVYDPPIVQQPPPRIQSPSSSVGIKRPQIDVEYDIKKPSQPIRPSTGVKTASKTPGDSYQPPLPYPPAVPPTRVKVPSQPDVQIVRPQFPAPRPQPIDHPNANIKGGPGYQPPRPQQPVRVTHDSRPIISQPPALPSISTQRIKTAPGPSTGRGFQTSQKKVDDIYPPQQVYEPPRKPQPPALPPPQRDPVSSVKQSTSIKQPHRGPPSSSHRVSVKTKQPQSEYDNGSSYKRGPETYPKPEFQQPAYPSGPYKPPIATPPRASDLSKKRQPTTSQNTGSDYPTFPGSSISRQTTQNHQPSGSHPASADYPYREVPGHQPPHQRQLFPHRDNPDHPNESLKGSGAYRPPPPIDFQPAASETVQQEAASETVQQEAASEIVQQKAASEDSQKEASKLGDTGTE